MKSMLVLTSIVSCLIATTVANAATETANIPAPGNAPISTITTAPPSQARELLNKLYVNYSAVYHGAPFDKLDSDYTIDHDGKRVNSRFNRTYFDSDLVAAYMIDKTTGAGPFIPFGFVPVAGQHFVIGDVGIKGFNRGTLNWNGLIMDTGVILQAPTSQYSADRNMKWSFKILPSLRYAVPKTNFKIGAWTDSRIYFGATMGRLVKVMAIPYVNYALSPKVALTLSYYTEAHHNVNDSGLKFTRYETDLEPGISWSITPKIFVNPFVQIPTTNGFNIDNAALGAVVSATLL